MLRFGAVLYFFGRLTRHMRHYRNNDAMVSQARRLARSRDMRP
jgi:hypothetical protein